MNDWMTAVNGAVVSLFGSLLSAVFCGVLSNRRNRWIVFGSFLLIPVIQALLLLVCKEMLLRQLYPLLMHLPLMVLLWCLTRKLLRSLIAVLTAYLCCQLRRWTALLTAALIHGGVMMETVVELIITLPLLLLLVRFVAPAVRQLLDGPVNMQLRFGIIPAVYYGFDYLTRIYTNLLTDGTPVAVEFMPFVCCVAYLVFLLYHCAEEREQSRLTQLQQGLNIQLTQAVREIETLRQTQALACRYRHDLRHHLRYLSACMEDGQIKQAQEYIDGICEEMKTQKIRQFCENETANLILSAFAERAEKTGIELIVDGAVPMGLSISDRDLCVVLSNALENAWKACQHPGLTVGERRIEVQSNLRNHGIFLQISNPCRETVRFKNGIPVSDQQGHGIGVQSICAVVEKCGGLCSFSQENGSFVFRMFIG